MSLYQLSLLAGVAFAFVALLLVAPRGRRGAWVDVALGAAIGAIVLGRAVHVLLHEPYFSVNNHEVFNLQAGGMSWQGALIGGLMGARLVAWWRNVAWSQWLDATFIALPALSWAGWSACWRGLCAYGASIPLDAEVTSILVHDARDVYGILDLRYTTQNLGVTLSLVLLLVACLLVWRGWGRGWRWGVMLVGVALISFIVGFLRGDTVPVWTLADVTLRADQWLDMALVVMGIAFALRQGRRSGLHK